MLRISDKGLPMLMRFALPLAAMLAGLSMPAAAQEPEFHTRVATEGAESPAASIAGLAWLVGQWEGPGVGGAPAQESWSSAFGGTMAGTFVQQDGEGGIQFYEFIQIAEEAGSLVVRLKHFNADMTGWEEKDDFVSFPLIAQEGDSWFFNGLTFRREGEDGYFVAVRMNHADGSQSDLVFPFRRVR